MAKQKIKRTTTKSKYRKSATTKTKNGKRRCNGCGRFI